MRNSGTTFSDLALQNETFKRKFYQVLHSNDVDEQSFLNSFEDIKGILEIRFSYDDFISWNYSVPLTQLTLLGWCAVLDASVLAILVLKKGANCNFILNEEGWTAFHIATVCQSHNTLREIVQTSGCDINLLLNGKISAFLLAIEQDDLESFDIIRHKKPSHFIDLVRGKKYALIEAIECDAQKCFERLMEMDVNVNTATETTFPLLAAVLANQVKMVKMLIKKGADIDREFKNATPLTAAAKNGFLEVIQILVHAKAQINYVVQKIKETALSAAIKSGSLEVIQFLSDNGANSEILTLDENDNEISILLLSILINSDDRIIKYILDKITEIEITSYMIQLCYNVNKFEILKLLCSKCKTPIADNLKNKWIFVFTENNKLEFLRTILEQLDGDFNIVNDDRRTPLMLAALYGHLDIVRYLFQFKDIDVKQKDVYGCIALHYIFASCNYDILERQWSDDYILAKNNKGYNPLHYAKNEATYRKIIGIDEIPNVLDFSEKPTKYSKNLSLEFIQSLSQFPNTAESILNSCCQGVGFGRTDPSFKIRLNLSVFQNNAIKHIISEKKSLLVHPITRFYLSYKENFAYKFIKMYAFCTNLVFAMLYTHLLHSLIPFYMTNSKINEKDRDANLWRLLFTKQLVLLYYIVSLKILTHGLVFYVYWIVALLSVFAGTLDWLTLNLFGLILAWINFAMILRNTSKLGLLVDVFLRALNNSLKVILLFVIPCLAFEKITSKIPKCFTTLFMARFSMLMRAIFFNTNQEFKMALLFLSLLAFLIIIPCNIVMTLTLSNISAVKHEAIQHILEIKANEIIVIDWLTTPLRVLFKKKSLETVITIYPKQYKSKFMGWICSLLQVTSDRREIVRSIRKGIQSVIT